MKIAIAMSSHDRPYHDNPYTAPKFGIYMITRHHDNVSYRLQTVFDNPIYAQRNGLLKEDEKFCSCSPERQHNFMHACEHYALLDVIGGSRYLLGKNFCQNTLKSLKNAGVSAYEMPPIIHKIDTAIKNFLIGAKVVHSIQNIHHAS